MFQIEKKATPITMKNDLEEKRRGKINEYGFNLTSKVEELGELETFISRPETFVNKEYIQGKR